MTDFAGTLRNEPGAATSGATNETDFIATADVL
jgi:hypothetical protein